MSVVRYDARLIGRSIDWLVHGRETHNFTYDLDDRNLDQLCWFVSAVTGAEIGQVRAWTQELDKDEDLIGELTRRLATNPPGQRHRAALAPPVRLVRDRPRDRSRTMSWRPAPTSASAPALSPPPCCGTDTAA